MAFRHIATRILFLLSILTLPGGCSSRLISTEPVEITFSFPSSSEFEFYQQLADAFQEEHPGIIVKLRPDPTGTWVRDERNLVDAFSYWLDYTLIQGDSPVVRSLDPLLLTDPSLSPEPFYARSLEDAQWEGSLWALPAAIDVELVFYNKDIFNDLGVRYPQSGWTWDDFLFTAQQVTTVGVGGTLGSDRYIGLAPLDMMNVVSFIHQHGGELFDFGDPLTAEALQWCADLALVHGVAPLPGTYSGGWQFFANEHTAMWFGNLSSLESGRGNDPWEFEWGAVPLPRDEVEGGQIWVYQYFFITMRSNHPNEAWSWIKYLVSQPANRGLPPLRSVAESAAYRSEVGDELADAAAYAVEHAMPPLDSADFPSQEVVDAYTEAIESILSGELLAAEALEALVTRFGE